MYICGGVYNDSGAQYPAADRGGYYPFSTDLEHVSTRAVIYLK